jgi:hypothetical protein
MLRLLSIARSTLPLVFALGAPFAVLAQSGPTTGDLALWLKADSGLAADGSTWTDSSGNGHNATAVAGEAPTVQEGALNGLPVAEFSGGQSMSIAGQVVSGQHFTILAVVVDTSVAGGGFREIISNWDTKTRTNSIFLGTIWSDVGGVTADRIRFTDAIGGEDQGQTGQGQIAEPAKAFILTGLASGHNALIRLDKKTEYQLGAPFSKRNLTKGWYLGVQGDANEELWEGDIAEVLVYDAPLSKAEFATDLNYLETKWLPPKK